MEANALGNAPAAVIGQQVVHALFGRGRICSADARYFTVNFEENGIGEKTFVFPDAFRTLISFEDAALQSGAEAAATDAERRIREHSREIQERCIREASAPGGNEPKGSKTGKKSVAKKKKEL